MAKIYRYRKITDEFTTHAVREPEPRDDTQRVTELASPADGYTYIAVPDGVTLPPQPREVTLEEVVLDAATRGMIAAASPHVRLINERVVALIRDRYSINDEIGVLRTAPSLEADSYNAFVEKCRAWGRGEKAKLGL